MLALVKPDTTLVVVLSHDGKEIERQVTSSPDAAVAVAIKMLCRRGDDLRAGDALRGAGAGVMGRISFRRWEFGDRLAVCTVPRFGTDAFLRGLHAARG